MHSITPTQKNCTIKLNINLKNALPEDDSLFITGNLPQLGNWDPAGKRLEAQKPGIYSIELTPETGSIIECKITRGNWKTQGIYDLSDIPPSNLVIKAQANREVEVSILDWLDKQVLHSDPIIGEVVSSPEFECRGLKYKRNVQVWKSPECKDYQGPFSVLYMHDGQNLFEPSSAFAGVDWKVDEVVTTLLAENEIKPCIVVAIPNSPDRMQELNLFTQSGKAYADFLVNEVKPWVKKNFKVSSDPYDHVIMGSSMGGLMSFQMVCAYPGLFKKAGCLSSAFQKTDGRIFQQVGRSNSVPSDCVFYLDTGEYEPPIAKSYFHMMNILKDKGFIEGYNLMGFFDESATHCEAAWAKRLHLPLKFLLKK